MEEEAGLNGEIVLLGALYGVPTPYNSVVRRMAVAAAKGGSDAVPHSLEALTALVEAEAAAAA